MEKIKIIEIKSELGAGTRGSSMGVVAIYIEALDFNSPAIQNIQFLRLIVGS